MSYTITKCSMPGQGYVVPKTVEIDNERLETANRPRILEWSGPYRMEHRLDAEYLRGYGFTLDDLHISIEGRRLRLIRKQDFLRGGIYVPDEFLAGWIFQVRHQLPRAWRRLNSRMIRTLEIWNLAVPGQLGEGPGWGWVANRWRRK